MIVIAFFELSPAGGGGRFEISTAFTDREAFAWSNVIVFSFITARFAICASHTHAHITRRVQTIRISTGLTLISLFPREFHTLVAVIERFSQNIGLHVFPNTDDKSQCWQPPPHVRTKQTVYKLRSSSSSRAIVVHSSHRGDRRARFVSRTLRGRQQF